MIGSSSQPSAEASAIYALLAVVADPKKTKARLDELEQVRTAAEAAQEKHRLTLDEIRNTTAVNVNALAAGDKALAERTANISNQQSALNSATADLRRAEQAFADQRTEFVKQVAEANAARELLSENLAKRELALDTREHALKELEERSRDSRAAAAVMQDDARAIKIEYEQKLAGLQAALRKV